MGNHLSCCQVTKVLTIPGDSRSWESPEKADNVWQLFFQISEKGSVHPPKDNFNGPWYVFTEQTPTYAAFLSSDCKVPFTVLYALALALRSVSICVICYENSKLHSLNLQPYSSGQSIIKQRDFVKSVSLEFEVSSSRDF